MPSPSPWPVVGVTAFCSVLAGTYAATQLEPTPIVSNGIIVLPFLACAWWVHADSQLRRLSLVYDWGLLAWVAWPLLIPWYAWATRRQAGWRLALGLYTALLLPYLAFGLGLLWAIIRIN